MWCIRNKIHLVFYCATTYKQQLLHHKFLLYPPVTRLKPPRSQLLPSRGLSPYCRYFGDRIVVLLFFILLLFFIFTLSLNFSFFGIPSYDGRYLLVVIVTLKEGPRTCKEVLQNIREVSWRAPDMGVMYSSQKGVASLTSTTSNGGDTCFYMFRVSSSTLSNLEKPNGSAVP